MYAGKVQILILKTLEYAQSQYLNKNAKGSRINNICVH